MTNHDTRQRIEALEEERERLLQKLTELREAVRAEVDGDVGEGDPNLVERDRTISLIQVEERKLIYIDQALRDLRAGTYGICENCGKAIDPQRLEAIPEATLCINCKKAVEKQYYHA